MRRLLLPLALAFAVALTSAVFADKDKDKDVPEGFTALFNGKDLSGWKVNEGGKMEKWGADKDKGILYVEGGGGGWLMTEKEYGDFEIRLEFKMPKHGNSGVALRSPMKGDPAYVGMEIQLLDDEDYKDLKPFQYTGSIYGVVPPSKRVTKPAGEWQSIRIVAKGRQVMVEVNGTKVVDANLDDHKDEFEKHPGLKVEKGHLGLQSHDGRVEFRNIYVKPL